MNTGEIIDTTNLILKPGNNNMDNEPFIKMLRDDGRLDAPNGQYGKCLLSCMHIHKL